MRIVIDLQPCQNGSRRRGIGRHTMALLKAILRQDRGHEFLIALNDAFPESIDDIREELAGLISQDAFLVFSVPPFSTSSDPANAWRNRAAEMARSHFLESLSPDLVFIPSLNEGFWDPTIVSIEKHASYPTAVVLYDLIPLEDPDRHLGGEDDRKAYMRRLDHMRRADLILPISEYVAQEAAAKLQLRPDQVVVAPCGVDSLFTPPPYTTQRETLLNRYGITHPFVMIASPLEHRKNIEGLIAGFASMTSTIRNAHQIVLAGKMDSYARGYLGDLARSEGLSPDALVFAGYVPDADLPALYHHSSVFAFPSFSEGFGLPLLEAMACGTPVVGSDRTSIPEVVGRDDLLCDPADAIAIGRAIERILASEDLQRELRAYGPQRAARFTWEKSATTVLDAFEALHAKKAQLTASPLATAPAGPLLDAVSRPTMAYVFPEVPVEHRLSGVNNAMAAALSEAFDLTVVTSAPKRLSVWTEASCTVRDIAWFDSHAAQFDHILYATDIMADADLRLLMSRHAGSLLLTERLSPPSTEALTGRMLCDGAQLALFEQSGLKALCGAVEGNLNPAAVMALLADDLAARTGQIFFESAESTALSGLEVGILPAPASPDARHELRARMEIEDNRELIVALAADEQAAEDIVRVFRESLSSRTSNRTLMLFRDAPHIDSAPEIQRLFGEVIRYSGELDPIYCGLLAGADLLVLDRALPEFLLSRFERDSSCAHVISMSGDAEVSHLRTLLAPDDARDNDKTAFSGDITGTEGTAAAVAALRSSIYRSTPNTVDRSLQDFARQLPAEVRGIRPDSDDVAQLVSSLSQNEAHTAPTRLYIDVTAFAAPNTNRRIDVACRKWLGTLLRLAGPHVRAVYAKGDRFVAANRFAAKIGGVRQPGLVDETINVRPGDHILGFDVCHAFSAGSHGALLAAQRRGLAIGYVVLGSLALDREEILRPLADLLLNWCAETHLNVHASVSALPRVGRASASLWQQRRHQGTITGLLEAGLCANILFCDDTVPFVEDMVSMELSPAILEACAEWETLRRQPLAGTSRRAATAADFGHVVTGHMLGSYSLAIINRMIAHTLENRYPGQVRYLPVETTPIDHTEGVPASEKPLMMELSSRPPLQHKGEIVISHHYPVLVPQGEYSLSLGLFFWEESQVPTATVALLADSFDAIISPSRSVTNALVDSGLSIPIATIGQPVDVERYAVLAKGTVTRGPETTFLHVSSSFKRKGIDVLLSAWAKAFTSADTVKLVIKTFPNPHNDVEEQVAVLRAHHPDLAPIVVVNRDVDIEEMPRFYEEADVMVLPTRGEGYNLPALEAMAAGLPLIVTGHGGHRDFCGPQEARLIRYRFAKSESHVGDHHSMWVEPDVADLTEALREQIDPDRFEEIETRRRQAMQAAMHESNETLWLRRYDMMIGELQADAYHKPARIAWISTWAVQCGIAQYSGYLLDRFTDATRNQILVVCDHRTSPAPGTVAGLTVQPVWDVRDIPKVEQMLEAIGAHEAEAVVIQHQDGLLSWRQFGELAADERLAGKTTIAILHNAANMRRLYDEERAVILQQLGKLTRVLVHNIADINALAALGLTHNVGLFPHGAFAKSQAPWPRRLGATDTPIIGCHGFFFRHKGIDKLIRAAALLRQEWPRLKLRLVNARFPDEGHDDYIRECKQLANDLGLADAIEWYQDFLPIEQIDNLLSDCDVISLPYDESDDSASGAVRVSLSSMVPLVATKVKIFAELGEAAEWVPSNDPEALADVLAMLLRSPERRRTVQAAMHEWLASHDWNRVASTLEGLINGLVKQKRLGWDSARHG